MKLRLLKFKASSKGKAIEIDISGDSLDELKLVSEQVRRKLSEIDGVIASEIDFETGKNKS